MTSGMDKLSLSEDIESSIESEEVEAEKCAESDDSTTSEKKRRIESVVAARFYSLSAVLKPSICVEFLQISSIPIRILKSDSDYFNSFRLFQEDTSIRLPKAWYEEESEGYYNRLYNDFTTYIIWVVDDVSLNLFDMVR